MGLDGFGRAGGRNPDNEELELKKFNKINGLRTLKMKIATDLRPFWYFLKRTSLNKRLEVFSNRFYIK